MESHGPRVVRFCRSFLTLNGSFKGQPFVPLPWMEEVFIAPTRVSETYLTLSQDVGGTIYVDGRVTRLDGCGRIKPSACSSIVSDGFVSVAFTANIEEGEAITVTNDGTPLCARHATIFMTAQRLQARYAETRSLTAAGR